MKKRDKVELLEEVRNHIHYITQILDGLEIDTDLAYQLDAHVAEIQAKDIPASEAMKAFAKRPPFLAKAFEEGSCVSLHDQCFYCEDFVEFPTDYVDGWPVCDNCKK